jgi:hypothetical protein
MHDDIHHITRRLGQWHGVAPAPADVAPGRFKAAHLNFEIDRAKISF